MGGTTLLDVGELNDVPGIRVTSRQAAAVESVVWGWVRPVLGFDERPAAPSPEVKSAVLELAVLFINSGAQLSAIGERRRTRILESLGRVTAVAAGGSTGPVGDFPPPAYDVEPTRSGW
jgi:hypothetical protein